MKEWGGKKFDTDWYEIDSSGNRISDQKDWQSNREWDEANAPGGAWNFSPAVMASNPVISDTKRQSYGTPDKPLPAPGSGAAGAAPYGTAPTTPGGTAPGAPAGAPAFDPNPPWMNWQPPTTNTPDAQALGALLGAKPSRQDQSVLIADSRQPPPPVIINDVREPPPAPAPAPTPTTPPTAPTQPPPTPQPAPQLPTPPQPTPQQSALESSLYGSLTNQINGPTTVDRNDPAYQQQINAYSAGSQRSAERARAAAAARMHASGTDAGGGFDAMVNRVNQDQGLNEQAFEAQLMDSFRNQNLDRQARAQQLGAGLVSTDRQLGQQESQFGRQLGQQESQFGRGQGLTREQMALQNQQFGLGQGLTREQMALQESQFGRNLGQQESQFGRNLGQQESQFGRQLGQQDRQFNTGQTNALWMNNQGNQLSRELGLGDLDIRKQGLGLQRELGLGDLDYRRDALGQQLALSQAGLNQQALLALLGGF